MDLPLGGNYRYHGIGSWGGRPGRLGEDMPQDPHGVSWYYNFLLKWEGKPQRLVAHSVTVSCSHLNGTPQHQGYTAKHGPALLSSTIG
ncbi:hypothetical protein ES703_71815 [subsurface metagenome]